MATEGKVGVAESLFARRPAVACIVWLGFFVIHAFNRRDCRLDGGWMKCE